MSKRRARVNSPHGLATTGNLALAEAATAAPEAVNQFAIKVGASGQTYDGKFFGEEWNADLADPLAAAQKYDRIRIGNGMVASLLQRVEGPIAQATWSMVDGKDAPRWPSEESADVGKTTRDLAREDLKARARWVVESSLFGAPFPEYAMRTPWRQVVHEALTSLALPFAIFERVLRQQSGRLGEWWVTDELAWIHPQSIGELRVDKAGRFVGVLQDYQHAWNDSTADASGLWQTESKRTFIPASRLVIVSRNREGANIAGVPLTRHMYGDIRRHEHAVQWQMIDAQNRSVGIPLISLPKGATTKQVQEAGKVGRRLTMGNKEQAYVVAEDGTTVAMVNMSAAVVDHAAIVRAQESRMRGMANAEAFALGQEGSGGTQALASEITPYFDMFVASVADGIRSDFQRGVIDVMHSINFGDSIPAPELAVSNIARPNVEQILAAIEKQAVQADGDVEQALRSALTLPPLPADEVTRRNKTRGLPKLGGEGFGLRSLIAGVKDLLASGQINTTRAGELLSVISGEAGWADPARGAVWSDPAAQQKGGGGPDGGGERGGPPMPAGGAASLAEKRTPAAPDHGNGDLKRETWRKLTAHEATYMRLGEVDAAFTAFVADYTQDIRAVREAMIRQAAAKSRPTATPGKLEIGRPSPKPLIAKMREYAAKMRAFGNEQASEEIRRQVADLTAASLADPFKPPRQPSVPDPAPMLGRIRERVDGALDVVVEMDANRIAADIISGLQDGYLRAIEAGASHEDAMGAATRELLERSDKRIDAAARNTASRAFNGGRSEAVAEAQDEFEGTPLDVTHAVRTEVLDGATCASCIALDGKRVAVDSDDYFAFLPPAHCLGGANCRGMYSYEVGRDDK